MATEDPLPSDEQADAERLDAEESALAGLATCVNAEGYLGESAIEVVSGPMREDGECIPVADVHVRTGPFEVTVTLPPDAAEELAGELRAAAEADVSG